MTAVPYLRLPRPTLWLVKGDSFEMGGDGPGEGPRFSAEVRSFYIARAPVTNVEYEAFDPAHERAATAPDDRDPVVAVSFAEAVGYCRWYAEASGKPFRLPTEVEWEFACRAGTRTLFPWGDAREGADPHVWDADDAGGRAHEVETRTANAFGLHDLLGNVWEWTSSLHLPYPVVDGDERDAVDAAGARAVRGGSFRTRGVGSATRASLAPEERRDDVGFRIVRSL